MRKHYLLHFLISLSLFGCANSRPVIDNSSIDEIQKTMEDSIGEQAPAEVMTPPEEVTQALLPSLMPSAVPGDEQERFNLSVDGLNARDFFMSLVNGTDYNMVVHPDVSGTISLDLQQVTVDEVMEVVRSVYGYAFKKHGKLFQVMPSGLRTEVFKINYLNVKRSGLSETQVSAGRVSDAGSSGTSSSSNNNNSNNDNSGNNSTQSVVGTKIRTRAEADFWSELSSTLEMLVGEGKGQKIMMTPQAGIVVVRALPEEIEAVREYLDKAELTLRRQVVIEAKILEVRLNDGFQSGIDWSAVGRPSDNKSVIVSQGSASLIDRDNVNGVFSINADLNDFTAIIDLLESQGTVQVLSSPRISTVNNQKAVIKVGTDEFFVTEVSTTTTTNSGGSVTTPTVELTPFFSGIALDVTPQISDEDEVVLHIHPSVSQVEDQQKVIAVGQSTLNLPLALSSIRETDSIVFAKNRQVVVIGGLMQNSSTDIDAGTPYLQHVPVIGTLFKQKRQQSVKSELVILLKPIVMDESEWRNVLRDSSMQFERLRQQRFD